MTLAMETKNNEDYTVKDLYPSTPTETVIKAALQVVPQQNWILSQDPEKILPIHSLKIIIINVIYWIIIK